MLSEMLDTSLTILTLNALSHNTLNTRMIDDVVVCMAKNDWTCHVCGVKLYGMMEVDHLKGHNLAGKAAIAPICQFCHDRKHMLWAASRGKFRLMHAPDLTYEDISHLTWAKVSHTGQEGFSFDAKKMGRDLNARCSDASDMIGHDNVEAVLEALFALHDKVGYDEAKKKAAIIDTHIKLVPVALTQENAVIQSWSDGGFRPASDMWKNNAVSKNFPGYAALQKSGDFLKSKL